MAEGYKDWAAGDILTAADLEDYTVKQSVMRFADASARTSALSSVLAEGMVSYLKDTNSVEVYDGSSWAAIAGGKILQVVSTTKTDTFSESLSAFAISSSNVTGLTASITPSSASNKVLVIVELNAASSGSPIVSGQIFRDSTAIGIGDAAGSRVRVSGHLQAASGLNAQARASMSYLDSPSTTSSVTYGFRNYNPSASTATIYVNRSQGDSDTAQYARSASTITVMEVSA